MPNTAVGKPKYDKSKNCVKCKETIGKIVVRHAVYCKYAWYALSVFYRLTPIGTRDCFFPFMSFKFRRSLEPFVNEKPDGPRKTALKPTGDLLLGYSGGLGSSVLLDLVHRSYISPDLGQGGTNHPRKDRVWKKINVCYVEVCDAFPKVSPSLLQAKRALNLEK